MTIARTGRTYAGGLSQSVSRSRSVDRSAHLIGAVRRVGGGSAGLDDSGVELIFPDVNPIEEGEEQDNRHDEDSAIDNNTETLGDKGAEVSPLVVRSRGGPERGRGAIRIVLAVCGGIAHGDLLFLFSAAQRIWSYMLSL